MRLPPAPSTWPPTWPTRTLAEPSCSRIARSTSSRPGAMRSIAAAKPPGAGGGFDIAAKLAVRAAAVKGREDEKPSWIAWLNVVHGAVTSRSRLPAQPRDRVGDVAHGDPLGAARQSARGRSLWQEQPAEAEPRGLGDPQVEARDAANLAAEPDLAAGGGVGRERQVEPARHEGERDAEVRARLPAAHSARCDRKSVG